MSSTSSSSSSSAAAAAAAAAAAQQRPGLGSLTDRLQGSLKDSAIARLLLKGRPTADKALPSAKGGGGGGGGGSGGSNGSSNGNGATSSSSSSTPAAASGASVAMAVAMVASVSCDARASWPPPPLTTSSSSSSSSPPPPIDLSTTNRGTKLRPSSSSAAAASSSSSSSSVYSASSFSLTTIKTMERLRYILTCEMQSLLTRLGSSSSSSSSSSSLSSKGSDVIDSTGSTLHPCRLCPYVVSQVIELLAHYRSHSDNLVHIGHKSPDVLCDWFDYYLNAGGIPRPVHGSTTTPLGPGPGGGGGGGDPQSPSGCTCPPTAQSSCFDLRDLLTKPLKSDDRSSTLTLTRHRASSESHILRSRAVDDLSRSSTPYTITSALTDEDTNHHGYNPTPTPNPAKGIPNGRQLMTTRYDVDMTSEVKYEADDVTTSTGSVQCFQDGGNSPPNVASDCLGRFQNGRRSVDRSPPTLKCEVDVDEGHENCLNIREFNYFRSQVKVSDGRMKVNEDSTHPELDQMNPHQQNDRSIDETLVPCDVFSAAGRQCQSPPNNNNNNNREPVELRYAYKQYKRLRKNNTPKSFRPDALTLRTGTPDDQGHCTGSPMLCHASEDAGFQDNSGIRGTHSGSPARNTDIGIQCNLIVPGRLSRTEPDVEDTEEVGNQWMDDRWRRKRPFPVDENEDSNLTPPDAECLHHLVVRRRCIPCGVAFDDDVIFSIHMGCHSHAHPFVCNICGRQCENKYAFNTHILRGHHPT